MHVLDLFNENDRKFLNGESLDEGDVFQFPGSKPVRKLEKPGTDTSSDNVVRISTGPKKQTLSLKDLVMISDKALDEKYKYGRSVPGLNFGWLSNMNSTMFAKRAIESGETNIEKIAAEVHKGWATVAVADYKNKLPMDPPTQHDVKLRRLRMAQIPYNELPEKEKEKDRVVARALLQAIGGVKINPPTDPDLAEGDVVPMQPRPRGEPVVNVEPASVLPFSQFKDPGTRKLEMWKQAVRDRYPEYGNRIRFVSKDNGRTISAEIPRVDRSFGVFDMEKERGRVLDEADAGVEEGKTGPGLWANIHAKRERIKHGSGERMRKPGSKGAPTAQNFKDAAKKKQEGIEETIGPAATADLLKGSPAGSSWTSYMDWKDKANQREYQANILRDKEAHALALKLGGRPPSPGVLGTGIFANMNVQQFEQWLKQHPQALQAFSAYSSPQQGVARVIGPAATQAMSQGLNPTEVGIADRTDKSNAMWNQAYAEKARQMLARGMDPTKTSDWDKFGKGVVEGEMDEASLAAMRDYFASNQPAQSNNTSTKEFNSLAAYKRWLEQTKQQKLKSAPTANQSVPVEENTFDNNPVVQAIIRRILTQKPDLLKYGADLVGDAIDEVASFVGQVDVIGNSDVNAWVAQVERIVKQQVGSRKPAIEDLNEVSDEKLIDYLVKVHQDALKHPADPTKRSPEKRNKSVQGFSRAFNKLDARRAQDLAPRVGEDADTKPEQMDHRDYIKQAEELHSQYMEASRRNDKEEMARLKAERDALDALARKGLKEAETEGRPRIRKYTKMRPDGSKAVRYEVLDYMGRRAPGQGTEGFDDLKYAREFLNRNRFDLSDPMGEELLAPKKQPTQDAEPKVAESSYGRYWCSTDKRWKDRQGPKQSRSE